MKRLLKTFKLWLTFWASGLCIVLSMCMVALHAPARPTRAMLALAARLLNSSTTLAVELYGTGRLM